ncbi:unnamed protein product [Danaus chrysippus]|uniref:(African queen) hypothetical protein n=1 Tax=Danaus chrysippus TaxID=151541 RepID=A0A8J2QIN2_9NEOP|nr:unnamed protein product [Danaus chrysippus]
MVPSTHEDINRPATGHRAYNVLLKDRGVKVEGFTSPVTTTFYVLLFQDNHLYWFTEYYFFVQHSDRVVLVMLARYYEDLGATWSVQSVQEAPVPRIDLAMMTTTHGVGTLTLTWAVGPASTILQKIEAKFMCVSFESEVEAVGFIHYANVSSTLSLCTMEQFQDVGVSSISPPSADDSMNGAQPR